MDVVRLYTLHNALVLPLSRLSERRCSHRYLTNDDAR